MKCELRLCVYWQDDECILNQITIDSLGMCSECILVDIDESILAQAREDFFRRTEETH